MSFKYFGLIMICFFLGRASVRMSDKYDNLNKAIDLPEEINLVTKQDTLRGYYTHDGILHIEFYNKNNKLK